MSKQLSENRMREMVAKKPQEFLEWLGQTDIEPTTITFAYEILGEIDTTYKESAITLLRKGLSHNKDYVREGAIYGLQQLYSFGGKEVLESHKDNDILMGLIEDILEWEK